jgi:alkylhydroperoxidase/carboxymuconolactone decarboxylase family protein YurZ
MLNYRDRLRRLALNEPQPLGEMLEVAPALDSRMLAIARLASLIAVGGTEPTFGEYTDAALSAGATADEIVGVLTGVGSVVGVPRVVSAASKVAVALGVDVDQFES